MAHATRTVVMTGSSGGIGHEAAKRLLKQTSDVQLVAFARSDPEGLARKLAKETGNPNVHGVQADLASVASLRSAISEVRRGIDEQVLPPLAGLIGNAGVQLQSATAESADGHELTFAVNVLANYVLVDGLRDRLADGARLVLTTSDTHFGDFKHNMGFVHAPVWRDPTLLATAGSAPDAESAKAGQTAYATSKLALIYLTHELARRLPSGVTIYSFNPALVPGTGLQRSAGAVTNFIFRRVMLAMTLTPLARTIEASGDALADAWLKAPLAPSGSYINGPKPERSSEQSYDEQREAALWAALERLAG